MLPDNYNKETVASMAMTQTSSTPVITRVDVIPVAGRDSMLLNLSGAHAPYFTRNLVVLTDSGRAAVTSATRVQRPWVDGLAEGMDAKKIAVAAEVLAALHSRLASDVDAAD